MNSMITGGAGFIGSHLAARLVADGDHVTILDDLSSGTMQAIAPLLATGRCTFVHGSILDADLVDEAMRGCEEVYHLAAMVGVQRVLADPVAGMRVNMIGTDNVMRAASRYRPRVAFASSSEIYGTGTEGRLSEEGQRVYGATRTYRWAYAGAKALAESLLFACASQARFPAVVLRPFNVVGPGQQPESGMVLPRFVAAALAGTPITVFGNGTQTRSFVHVDDVVAAMVAAVREPRAHGLAMNVGNDRPISIVGLAHLVRTVAASRSPIEFVPYERAYPPGFEEIMQRVPDLRVITRAIGFRPTHSIGAIVYQLVAAAREVISP